MTEREKPFPVFVTIVSTMLIALGFSGVVLGRGEFMSGWSVGFGTCILLCAVMVWASPMNERKR